MKKIFILGASGSIGENALSVIDSNKENFELIGISANSNIEKVNEVIKKYNPKYIYINDKSARENILKTGNEVICEDENELSDIFNSSDVDIVISAISGFAGIKSTFQAAKSGKKLLLANKESIVAGGSLLMKTIKENNTELVPIDRFACRSLILYLKEPPPTHRTIPDSIHIALTTYSPRITTGSSALCRWRCAGGQ